MVLYEHPLSSLQQGMLFQTLSVPGGGVDILQVTIDYREPLRLDILQRAWQLEADRHPVLRSSFHWVDVSEPVQRVHADVALRIERRPAVDAASFAAFLAADRLRGFDLNTAPLTRLTVFEMGPNHFRLVWTLHHILMDGHALGIVLQEVQEQYDRLSRGELPVTTAGREYRSYVWWQRSQDLSGATAFWRAKLAGLEEWTPLPPDWAKGATDTTETATVDLSEAATSALARIASANGFTLSTIVMGVWGILLARCSQAGRVMFGAVKDARAGSVTDASSVVGLFLNILPVRMDLDEDPSAIDALRRLRAEWLSLRKYEFTPLSVIKRAASAEGLSSLFDTIVVFHKEPLSRTLSALSPCWRTRNVQVLERTGYALTFQAFAGPPISLQIEFDHRRISAATAEQLLAHARQLLISLADDPQATVSRLPLLTESESTTILREWNRTEAAYPRDVPLAELIDRQVARTPEAVAVVSENDTLTYRDLDARANRLATVLRTRGAGPDVVVGVCLERSADLVVTLLAIVKTGGAYLPLDPLLPADRIAFMLEDSGTTLVVANASTRERLLGFRGTVVPPNDAVTASGPVESSPVPVTPEHLAYVIYTSGSTGKPKGVQIPRGALTNFLSAMRDWLGLTEADRVLALTTISFDIAGLEFWLPLLVGAQIVVASREAAADPTAVQALIARHDITFLQATPVTWRMLLDTGWPGKQNLQAVCGGEAMPQHLAAALAPAVLRLWNLYGPTETTIWSTGYLVQDGRGPVLIGRPLPNTRCYILDAALQPVPVGVVGELCIGGDGLARGYLNRPELTAEKFAPDPFSTAPGARMYRTGDLARFQADGQIECLGRTDHQVKVRGFRIEPGEIEARLAECEGIAQSVVVARDDGASTNRLVAYVVPKPGASVVLSHVREWLRTALPEYMVPACVVVLDALPLTANGKTDRAALPSPVEERLINTDAYRAPGNLVEFALAAIWADVLNVDRVGIDDSFFDLGGDSLLSVALLSRVLARFPATPPSLAGLLQAPTVAQFAKIVSQDGAPVDIVVKVREGKRGRPPFFCIPGAGGNILSLQPLALAMPDDVPFYCLQAKGLDGSPPFGTVEDTARCYMERIRRIQPAGPYHLGGGCYGGLVAFETARLLEAEGESVHLLALIDTHNFAYARSLPLRTFLAANLRYYLARTGHHLREAAHLSARGTVALWASKMHSAPCLLKGLVGIAVGSKATQFPALPDVPFRPDGSVLTEVLTRVWNASIEAARSYVPSPYHGEVLLFRAAVREPQIYEDETLGWAPLVLGGITVVDVPGDHSTMITQPHVRVIAGRLTTALEQCSDRERKLGHVQVELTTHPRRRFSTTGAMRIPPDLPPAAFGESRTSG